MQKPCSKFSHSQTLRRTTLREQQSWVGAEHAQKPCSFFNQKCWIPLIQGSLISVSLLVGSIPLKTEISAKRIRCALWLAFFEAINFLDLKSMVSFLHPDNSFLLQHPFPSTPLSARWEGSIPPQGSKASQKQRFVLGLFPPSGRVCFIKKSQPPEERFGLFQPICNGPGRRGIQAWSTRLHS